MIHKNRIIYGFVTVKKEFTECRKILFISKESIALETVVNFLLFLIQLNFLFIEFIHFFMVNTEIKTDLHKLIEPELIKNSIFFKANS